MTNKVYIIAGAVGLIFYFVKRKQNLNDKVKALKKVREKFGYAIAKNVERIFRFETNHFKQGFEGNYSAGMHPVSNNFPYGWTSLRDFWLTNRNYAPVGVMEMKEGKGVLGTGGGMKTYLKFPNFTAGAMSVAEIMRKRNNNGGSWFSTVQDNQDIYNDKLANIQPKIVEQLT